MGKKKKRYEIERVYIYTFISHSFLSLLLSLVVGANLTASIKGKITTSLKFRSNLPFLHPIQFHFQLEISPHFLAGASFEQAVGCGRKLVCAN